jgi:hypothetical protein
MIQKIEPIFRTTRKQGRPEDVHSRDDSQSRIFCFVVFTSTPRTTDSATKAKLQERT